MCYQRWKVTLAASYVADFVYYKNIHNPFYPRFEKYFFNVIGPPMNKTFRALIFLLVPLLQAGRQSICRSLKWS